MILLIDNYDSFTHNLVHLVAPLAGSLSVKVVRSDRLTVREIRQMAPKAVIVSPGPSVPEHAGISLQIYQTLSKKIPILGVCLGMQAMAVAFGGRIVRAQKAIHGKAWSIQHGKERLFRGLPNPLEVGRYHSLVVSRCHLPSTLLIDAETETGEIMALSHRVYPCYGVQFHPESLLTSCGSNLVQNFLDPLR